MKLRLSEAWLQARNKSVGTMINRKITSPLRGGCGGCGCELDSMVKRQDAGGRVSAVDWAIITPSVIATPGACFGKKSRKGHASQRGAGFRQYRFPTSTSNAWYSL